MEGPIVRWRFLWSRPDRGATSVEYGMLVFFVALAIFGSVTILGTKVLAMFNNAVNMF